jgi:hypothetical protein
MALENADGGGGDWITDDVYEELAEDAALAVLRILRIEPRQPVPGKLNEWEPVVVDMLVLSGRHANTVWRSERMTKAGLTNTLRSKWDPSPENMALKAKERVKIPRTEGTDLACRFGHYTSAHSSRQLVGLNAARAADMKRVEALFAEYGDDPYTAFEDQDRANAMAALGGPAEDRAPVTVGGAGTPAATDPMDEEPPF